MKKHIQGCSHSIFARPSRLLSIEKTVLTWFLLYRRMDALDEYLCQSGWSDRRRVDLGACQVLEHATYIVGATPGIQPQ